MRTIAMKVVCVFAMLFVVGHAARINSHGEGGDQDTRAGGQSEAESYADETQSANSSSSFSADWNGPKIFLEDDCAGKSLVEVDSNGDLVQPVPAENASLAELQGKSATMTFQIVNSDVKASVDWWGKEMETSGSATLKLTFNKYVARTWKYKKTKAKLIGHFGTVAAYATVGIDFNLQLNAYIGLQLNIPISWNMCASGTASCGHADVSMGHATVKRWFGGVSARGSAKISLGLVIEKANVLATKISAVSELTFNNRWNRKTCNIRYDVNAKAKAFSTATWLANKGVGLVNSATGTCLSEFDEPGLANIFTTKVWSGACGSDLR